jgi:hypothetical protein
MDAIGDTQLAVRAFLDEPNDFGGSEGWAYLVVYGILQVLYVQQDAARTLGECLGVELTLPEELRAIRDSRNASVGHPTNYTGRASTAISRMSLTTSGFMMLVHSTDGATEFKNISVREAAVRQTELMADLLNRAAEALMSEERDHRRQFRGKPLRAALPDTLGYMLSKVSEGLRERSSHAFAVAGLESIRGAITQFRELLEERGITDVYADSVGAVLADLDFAISRVAERLDGGHTDWTQRDAEVYAWFLHAKVDELRSLAREIDSEYESDEV